MNIAVIDMGTNTFHLMIVEVKGDGFHKIYSRKEAVQLGKGGINKGYITDVAGQRGLNALRLFKVLMAEHCVEQVFATATSAIRNAKNGKALVSEIYAETGIEVRVISGIEEAETIYYGVSHALELGDEKSLLMDIGGGSIEFVICNQHKIFWRRSFEVGGQRLKELFHKNDRITTHELNQLENYLTEHLLPLVEAVEIHQPRVLVGSSGTFDTLSDIYLSEKKEKRNLQATEFPLTLASFYDTYGKVISRNREERLDIPGMIQMRVDMIVVAVALLKFVIEKCRIEDIRVSAFALKEGVLLKTIHGLDAVNIAHKHQD